MKKIIDLIKSTIHWNRWNSYTETQKLEIIEKAKIVIRNGEKYYASGPSAGKKVGSVRGGGKVEPVKRVTKITDKEGEAPKKDKVSISKEAKVAELKKKISSRSTSSEGLKEAIQTIKQIKPKNWDKMLEKISRHRNVDGGVRNMLSEFGSINEKPKETSEQSTSEKIADLKEKVNGGSGSVNHISISFKNDIDQDTDSGEEFGDKIHNELLEMFGDEAEIDWRDNSTLEFSGFSSASLDKIKEKISQSKLLSKEVKGIEEKG